MADPFCARSGFRNCWKNSIPRVADVRRPEARFNADRSGGTRVPQSVVLNISMKKRLVVAVFAHRGVLPALLLLEPVIRKLERPAVLRHRAHDIVRGS